MLRSGHHCLLAQPRLGGGKLGFGGYRELRYVLRNPAAEHIVSFKPLAGFDLNPWDGDDEIPG